MESDFAIKHQIELHRSRKGKGAGGSTALGGPSSMGVHVEAEIDIEFDVKSYPWVAFFEAAADGDLDTVRALLDGEKGSGEESLAEEDVVNVNETDVDGFTALMIASAEGQEVIVEELLNRKADVHMKTYELRSIALHFAAKNGNTKIIEMLCKASPESVNASNVNADTPLVWACIEGRDEAVKVLLKHKAEVDVTNHYGATSLMCATMIGENFNNPCDAERANIVRLLLQNKPELVNRQDQDGTTAMHLAASCGYILCVKALLEFKADITIRNAIGETPLQEAEDTGFFGSEKCIEYLRVQWKMLEEESASRMLSILIEEMEDGKKQRSKKKKASGTPALDSESNRCPIDGQTRVSGTSTREDSSAATGVQSKRKGKRNKKKNNKTPTSTAMSPKTAGSSSNTTSTNQPSSSDKKEHELQDSNPQVASSVLQDDDTTRSNGSLPSEDESESSEAEQPSQRSIESSPESVPVQTMEQITEETKAFEPTLETKVQTSPANDQSGTGECPDSKQEEVDSGDWTTVNRKNRSQANTLAPPEPLRSQTKPGLNLNSNHSNRGPSPSSPESHTSNGTRLSEGKRQPDRTLVSTATTDHSANPKLDSRAVFPNVENLDHRTGGTSRRRGRGRGWESTIREYCEPPSRVPHCRADRSSSSISAPNRAEVEAGGVDGPDPTSWELPYGTLNAIDQLFQPSLTSQTLSVPGPTTTTLSMAQCGSRSSRFDTSSKGTCSTSSSLFHSSPSTTPFPEQKRSHAQHHHDTHDEQCSTTSGSTTPTAQLYLNVVKNTKQDSVWTKTTVRRPRESQFIRKRTHMAPGFGNPTTAPASSSYLSSPLSQVYKSAAGSDTSLISTTLEQVPFRLPGTAVGTLNINDNNNNPVVRRAPPPSLPPPSFSHGSLLDVASLRLHSGDEKLTELENTLLCGICRQWVVDNRQCRTCMELFCLRCLENEVSKAHPMPFSCAKCHCGVTSDDLNSGLCAHNTFAQNQAHKMMSTTTTTAAAQQHETSVPCSDDFGRKLVRSRLGTVEDMQRQLITVCPSAEHVALSPIYLVPGSHLTELSVAQLDVLEDLHHQSLRAIADAKLDHMRLQERMKLQEQLRTQRDLIYSLASMSEDVVDS